MRRTSAGVLLLLALLGAGIGYGLDQVLTAGGRATFAPTPLLPLMLVLLATGVFLFAWQVRRGTRGGRRVDPFRAMRTAMLARASSLLGAILAGFGAGLWIFLSTRPVSPPVGSVAAPIALTVAAVILIAAALVAEQFCTLPKDPDDREPRDPAE